MRREALEYLRCPACRGPFERAQNGWSAEINAGDLRCGACDQRWHVKGGIPDLVFPRELAKRDADSRRLWDRIGRLYDVIAPVTNVMRGCGGRAERRDLISRLELTPGNAVLEIAAGTGENLMVIGEQFADSVAVFGLDLSRRMIGVAARKAATLPSPPQLVLGSSSSLPFRADAFDAVLDGFGMKYYSDKACAMQEMLRVVKPRGKVVITDLGMPTGKARSFRQRLMQMWIPHVDEGPPLGAVPNGASEVSLIWDAHETAYVVEFRRPAA